MGMSEEDYQKAVEDHRAQHERHELFLDTERHVMFHAWDKLDATELEAVSRFLNSIAEVDIDNWQYAVGSLAQLATVIRMKATQKKGTCYVCGKDHESEEREFLASAAPAAQSEPPEFLDTPKDTGSSGVPGYAGSALEFMEEYGLERDPDTLAYRCKWCKFQFKSLADRALKGPYECQGCDHNMKWGGPHRPPRPEAEEV